MKFAPLCLFVVFFSVLNADARSRRPPPTPHLFSGSPQFVRHFYDQGVAAIDNQKWLEADRWFMRIEKYFELDVTLRAPEALDQVHTFRLLAQSKLSAAVPIKEVEPSSSPIQALTPAKKKRTSTSKKTNMTTVSRATPRHMVLSAETLRRRALMAKNNGQYETALQLYQVAQRIDPNTEASQQIAELEKILQ